MTTTMIMASISLEELFFSHNGDTLDGFGGGDGDTTRVALADYLIRRLLMSILPRVHGNIATEEMGIRHHCCCCGDRRGGEDDAGGGRLGRTMPFVLKSTSCRVLSLLLGGRRPMLEVILHAPYIIESSSKSATPATTPADQEELARAEQRIWEDNLDSLCPTLRMGIQPILASSSSRANRATP